MFSDTAADAYRLYIEHNNLHDRIAKALDELMRHYERDKLGCSHIKLNRCGIDPARTKFQRWQGSWLNPTRFLPL